MVNYIIERSRNVANVFFLLSIEVIVSSTNSCTACMVEMLLEIILNGEKMKL